MFQRVREVSGRWEYGIDANSECVFCHLGNDSLQKLRTQLQTWIRVHLYQPYIKFTVDHKVQSQQLKVMLKPFRIQLPVCRLYRINRNSFHPWINLLSKVVLSLAINRIQVPLELSIRHLVTVLVLTVRISVFLNRVVCQMNHLVKLIELKLVGGCSYVALAIKVRSKSPVKSC